MILMPDIANDLNWVSSAACVAFETAKLLMMFLSWSRDDWSGAAMSTMVIIEPGYELQTAMRMHPLQP